MENPALTMTACWEVIEVRIASKRGRIHGSGTLFCLMQDLILLIW